MKCKCSGITTLEENAEVKCLHLLLMHWLGLRGGGMTQKPFCRRDTGKGSAGAKMALDKANMFKAR